MAAIAVVERGGYRYGIAFGIDYAQVGCFFTFPDHAGAGDLAVAGLAGFVIFHALLKVFPAHQCFYRNVYKISVTKIQPRSV